MVTKNALEDLQLLLSLLQLLSRRGTGRSRANAILLLAAMEALDAIDSGWRVKLLDRLSAMDFSINDSVLSDISVSPIPDGLVEMVIAQAMGRPNKENE